MNIEQLGLVGIFIAGAIPWFEAIAVIPSGIIFGLDPVLTVIAAVLGKDSPSLSLPMPDLKSGSGLLGVVNKEAKQGNLPGSPRLKPRSISMGFLGWQSWDQF